MTNFIKRCHTPTQHTRHQNIGTFLVSTSMVNDLVWPWKRFHARIKMSPCKIGQFIKNMIISCIFSPKQNIPNLNKNIIFISKLPASNTAKILLRNELDSLVYNYAKIIYPPKNSDECCELHKTNFGTKMFYFFYLFTLYRSYVPLCKRGITPS